MNAGTSRRQAQKAVAEEIERCKDRLLALTAIPGGGQGTARLQAFERVRALHWKTSLNWVQCYNQVISELEAGDHADSIPRLSDR